MSGSFPAPALPTSATKSCCIDKDASKIDGAEERHHADLGAGSRGAGQGECRARPPELHDRSGRGRRGRGGRLHRRRNAGAARRRPRRPDLRVRRGPRACQGDEAGPGRGRHQVDRSGRHRRPDRPRSCTRRARRRDVGRVQPGIPARRRRDRATSSIPTASSSAPRTSRRAKCCAKSTGRCSSTGRRSCSPAAARPS